MTNERFLLLHIIVDIVPTQEMLSFTGAIAIVMLTSSSKTGCASTSSTSDN